jgi:Spy/CpxP family protein refolding chaperone
MKKQITLFSVCIMLAAAAHTQPPPNGNHPKPPTKEERLKHVSEKFEKELNLDAAQKQKLTAAYKDFFAAMEKLRNKDGKPMPPPPPPPPADREAVDKLVKARDAQVKAALNSTQFRKYTELEKTMRPPGPQGRPGPPQEEKKQ